MRSVAPALALARGVFGWNIFVASVLLAGVLASGLCGAAERSETAQDLTAIASRSLEIVEQHSGKITTLVVPADANPTLIAALKSLRPVIFTKAVPKSKTQTLPKGYLIIETLKVHGNDAKFTGILGPGALAGTLGAGVDCGLRYSITFSLTNGKWENGPYSSQQCSVD